MAGRQGLGFLEGCLGRRGRTHLNSNTSFFAVCLSPENVLWPLGWKGGTEFSGCYLFTQWVRYKTHPGAAAWFSRDSAGTEDTCFLHSFILQISVDTCGMSRADDAAVDPADPYGPCPPGASTRVGGRKPCYISFKSVSCIKPLSPPPPTPQSLARTTTEAPRCFLKTKWPWAGPEGSPCWSSPPRHPCPFPTASHDPPPGDCLAPSSLPLLALLCSPHPGPGLGLCWPAGSVQKSFTWLIRAREKRPPPARSAVHPPGRLSPGLSPALWEGVGLRWAEDLFAGPCEAPAAEPVPDALVLLGQSRRRLGTRCGKG